MILLKTKTKKVVTKVVDVPCAPGGEVVAKYCLEPVFICALDYDEYTALRNKSKK